MKWLLFSLSLIASLEAREIELNGESLDIGSIEPEEGWSGAVDPKLTFIRRHDSPDIINIHYFYTRYVGCTENRDDCWPLSPPETIEGKIILNFQKAPALVAENVESFSIDMGAEDGTLSLSPLPKIKSPFEYKRYTGPDVMNIIIGLKTGVVEYHFTPKDP